MRGVVVDIPDATIEMEFSPAEDQHDRDVLTFRFHNAEGQHCLVRVPSPKLLILDDGQELEYPS